MTIKTGSWFADIPPGHIRISISRGSPHWFAGWRGYRPLAPGAALALVSDAVPTE